MKAKTLLKGDGCTSLLTHRSRWVVLPAALAIAGLMVSTAFAAARSASHSSNLPTFTVAIDGDIDTLDPTFAGTTQARMVFVNMCWKLYDIDSKLTIQPQLASSLPTVSKNGLVVTIPLRHGVRFNDGTPFTAAAVKETLVRDMTAPGSGRAADLSPIKTVTAVNRYTVRLTLNSPYAPLASQLADRAGMIMSPKQLAKTGKNFGTSPVCVGPFSFKSRVPGSSITLTKSNYFWDAKDVHVGTVVYKIVPDGTVRAALLRSGDVDAAMSLAGPDLSSIRGNSSLRLRWNIGLATDQLRINLANHGPTQPLATWNTPLAQHPELRRALELALSRKQIVNVGLGRAAVPDCAPISTVNPYHKANPACPGQNVTLARQLIAKSGVATPISFTMTYLQGSDNQRVAQVIQSMLAQVGFQVTLQPVDIPTAVQDEASGNYQVIYSYWSGRVDPDGDVYSFYDTHGSQNHTGISNPTLDSLLTRARSATSSDARFKIYSQAFRLIQQERNVIPLFHPVNYTGVTKKAKGFAVYSDNLPRVYAATLSG